VKDTSQLVSWLARQPRVLLDRRGDPRTGITGASYGGGLALLAAAYDHRIDAVVAQSAWNNLATALFPNEVSGGGGGGGRDPAGGRGVRPAVGGPAVPPGLGRFRHPAAGRGRPRQPGRPGRRGPAARAVRAVPAQHLRDVPADRADRAGHAGGDRAAAAVQP